MVQRQRFYTELNDVQAERMFVENIMKLGNQFFFRIIEISIQL